MLKNLLRFSAMFAVAATMLPGCSSGSDGGGDPEPEAKKLVISASATEILSDGMETTYFTVKYGNDNVTETAVITNKSTGQDLAQNVRQFMSTTPGDVDFVASYDGKISNTLTITVTESIPDDRLTLSVDSKFVLSDGRDEVNFTVRLGSTDITSRAKVYNRTAGSYLSLNGEGSYSYSSTAKLEAEFIAEYDDLRSEPVTVTSVGSFMRNVLVQKFTGTWCPYCYPAGNALKQVKEEYGDRLNIIEVHYNDNMVSAMTSRYQSEYSIGTWPVLLFDCRERLGNTTASEYRKPVKNSLDNYPAACGFNVTNSVSDGTMTVKVRMLSMDEGDYYLVVALLEDGITGYSQETPTGTVDDYVYDNVLMGCAYASATGEPLGTVAAMTEVVKEYTFDIRRFEESQCHVVVYALRKTESGQLVVNNSTDCPGGGSVEYTFED